jgi:TolB protein
MVAAVLLVIVSTCFAVVRPAAAQAHVRRYANAFPQWSHDDREIVFGSTRDHVGAEPGASTGENFEIYVMRADGSRARRLTSRPGRNAHPAWLPPRADRIIFQSPANAGNSQDLDLYVLETNGNTLRRLLSAPGFNSVPEPSPDGRWVVFQRGTSSDSATSLHWELRLIDSSGGSEKALTTNRWSSQVASWFPDGREIAFHANPDGHDQLFVMDVFASQRVRPLVTSNANDESPAVSHDGRFVVFTSDRDGGRDLYLLTRASGNVTRLTSGLRVYSQPSWSHDGRRLVFSAAQDPGVRAAVEAALFIALKTVGKWRLSPMNAAGTSISEAAIFAT